MITIEDPVSAPLYLIADRIREDRQRLWLDWYFPGWETENAYPDIDTAALAYGWEDE